MANVIETVGVYSKKNGLVMKSRRVLTDTSMYEAIKYVKENYGLDFKQTKEGDVHALLSRKYIKITGK